MANPKEKSFQVMSLLTPAEVEVLGGLPAPGIVGIFEDSSRSLESFRPNRVFVEFLQQTIGEAGPTDESLAAAAERMPDSWLYVIDLSTPDGPQGRVPPEDILGGFRVESGQVVPGSYVANEEFKVLTANGLVILPPSLREAYLEALRRHVDQNRPH